MIQSLFEGSMYTFVLEWTPVLTAAAPQPTASEAIGSNHRGLIPHGYIFATFMVSIMVGSSLFKILSKYTRPESFMRVVLFIASLTLITPIVFPDNQPLLFAAFVTFEVCVGLFWPSMGYMRGIYVPENGMRPFV